MVARPARPPLHARSGGRAAGPYADDRPPHPSTRPALGGRDHRRRCRRSGRPRRRPALRLGHHARAGEGRARGVRRGRHGSTARGGGGRARAGRRGGVGGPRRGGRGRPQLAAPRGPAAGDHAGGVRARRGRGQGARRLPGRDRPPRHRRSRPRARRPDPCRLLGRRAVGGVTAALSRRCLARTGAGRQPVRPPDRGRLRPGRPPPRRGARDRRPRARHPRPDRRRRVPARPHRPAGPERPEAARDRAAGGPELRARGQPRPLAGVVAPDRLHRPGGPRPAHRRVRGRRAGALDPASGLVLRDGGPVRRSGERPAHPQPVRHR